MATKNELMQYFKSTYGPMIVSEKFDEAVVINFVTESFHQRIYFNVIDEFAMVASPVASMDEASADQVLRALNKCSKMLHGIRLVGDMYGVVHFFSIKDADPSEITFAVASVALQADELEGMLTGKDRY